MSCRRHRDQYTLLPGSFIQQRVTPQPSAAALKSSVSWDAAFHGSSNSSSYVTAAQQQLALQGQQVPDRPMISKAGAPAAIESKQHGGNSAFAALTAIDCITEETSSIATDSVMGSCPPSRESTAHGGGHYFRDIPGSPVFVKDQEGLIDGPKGFARAARGLGLSVLLPARSLGSSGVLSSSGSGEGLYAASPAAAAAVVNSSSSNASAKLQQLQLQSALEQKLASPVSPKFGSLESLSEGVHEAAAAAAGPVKKVRFTMERPAGSTPSRDYGLLYTAPELLNGQRYVATCEVLHWFMTAIVSPLWL